jgi:O-antigen/teichoic acid export membrane protein
MAGIYNRDSARRSLFDTVIYRAFSQVATVLGFIILVRGMSQEDFGVFNLLYAFIPVVSMVLSLGLEQTLRRFQPEYLRAGNSVAAAWLVRFISSARFGTTVIALAVVMLLWDMIAPIFKLDPYRAQFALFSFLVLLHFQISILQLSLASRMLHKLSVGSMAMLAYVKLLAYASFLFFDSLSLVNAILADTLAYGLAYLRLRYLYRKFGTDKDIPTGSVPDSADRKRMIRYGLYNNFNEAGTLMLGTKSDNLFIAAFIDPIAVGIYAFYTRINEMIGSLLPERLFQNVIQPLFFAVDRAEADRKIPAYFTFLVNINLLFQWPILAFSVVYHTELIRLLFGEKYVAYSLVLPLSLGFATSNLFSKPATLVAQYQEKSWAILMSKIFVAYNVVALIVLLPIAGIYGAVIATGSAQFFKNLFIWWFVRGQARWHNFGSVVASSMLIWGGAVALAYLLKISLPLHAVFHMLFGIVICGVAGLAYVRSPALSAGDRQILGNILRGREARLLKLLGILRSDVPKAS